MQYVKMDPPLNAIKKKKKTSCSWSARRSLGQSARMLHHDDGSKVLMIFSRLVGMQDTNEAVLH